MKRIEVLTMLFSGEVPDTPQKRFDANYVTAQELQEYLGVSRPAVLKKIKDFPYIEAGPIRLWERTEALEACIWDWAMRRIRNGDMEPTPAQLLKLANDRAVNMKKHEVTE